MHIQATTSQIPIQIDYTQISFPDRYDKTQFETLLSHPTVLDRFKMAMSASDGFTMVKKKHAAELLNIEQAKVKVPTIIFYKRKTDPEPKIYALFDEAIIGTSKIVKKMTPLEKDGLSYVEMVQTTDVFPGFLKEVSISTQLIEQNIESTLNLEFVAWDEKGRLIAEYYPFGSLRECVNQLKISSIYPGFECLDVIVQLATILESLHAHGFCHLDLKMDNIFVKPNGDQYKVVLGDLETVANISAGKVTLGGTFPPPEVPVYTEITPYPEIDLWALGFIISYLKNRRFRERVFTFKLIQSRESQDALECYLRTLQEEKHPWNPLILKLLSHNKDERPSAKYVKEFFINEMKKERYILDRYKYRDTHLEKHPIE